MAGAKSEKGKNWWDMETLYLPETHGSIFTAKPDVFLDMDRYHYKV